MYDPVSYDFIVPTRLYVVCKKRVIFTGSFITMKKLFIITLIMTLNLLLLLKTKVWKILMIWEISLRQSFNKIFRESWYVLRTLISIF